MQKLIFKLRQGASISRFVCLSVPWSVGRSVGRSVGQKKFKAYATHIMKGKDISLDE